MDQQNPSEMIIYQASDGSPQVDVQFEGDTIWLSAQRIADLFQISPKDVEVLIQHIYQDEELTLEATSRVWNEGGSESSSETTQYNLDMILSLSFRIRSAPAIRFRQWASGRLKEYLLKGFTMDDERLKGNGGGNYWKLYEKLTGQICDLLSEKLGIPGSAVYVTYHPISDWGFNGKNF